MTEQEKTSDAVKILHKRYINTFWRKVVYYCWHKPIFWLECKFLDLFNLQRNMAEKEKHFNFKLKDEFVRTLNRQKYKEASRFLRICRNRCEEMIDWNAMRRHFTDVALTGCTAILTKDLLKPEYR